MCQTKPPSKKTCETARTAFTLIELLIVVSLAGFLLVAAINLLINFTLLRSQTIGQSYFESHAYNLRRFLDAACAEGEIEYTSSAEQTQSANAGSQPTKFVQITNSIDPDAIDEKALQYRLSHSLALFSPPDQLDLETEVQLVLKANKGLYLLWKDPSKASAIDPPLIQTYCLSPWVQTVRYGYYESESDTWDFLEVIPDTELTPLNSSKKLYCLILEFEQRQPPKRLRLPIYLNHSKGIKY